MTNNEKIRCIESKYLKYAVGSLLYTPATKKQIASKICDKKYKGLRSIALCLEDSIADSSVAFAEEQLMCTLSELADYVKQGATLYEELPLIFIRVRNPRHMVSLYERSEFKTFIGSEFPIVTGFVLPKVDLDNANKYKSIITDINKHSKQPVYIMPTLESKMIVDISNRNHNLYKVKQIMDSIHEYVLNIRVGGNDFSNRFGIRRNCRQTIYDISVINNILADVINVFSRDYVVSGPVWEYFKNSTNNDWEIGLRRELELDKLNGFIGKTAIHPSQLPIINDCMMVDYSDYMDAKSIMQAREGILGVAKSEAGERMNEFKTHRNWAKKVLILARIYGVKNQGEW